MTAPQSSFLRILGMGKYLPQHCVSSAELEGQLGLPAGWAEQRSGVRLRYHSRGESGALLGARALEAALDAAGLVFADLDLLVCGAATFDYIIPNQASVIKREVVGGRDSHIPAFNVDSTCLSFVTALDLAAQLLDGRRYRRIGLVSAEVASQGLDPGNAETATLFGDGAAAAVVGWEPEGESRVIKAAQHTWSEGVFDTQIKGGGNAYHFREHPYDPALHSFAMQGKNLLRLASKKVPFFMEEFFADLPLSLAEVDLVVPHQASKFGLEMVQRLLHLRDEQYFTHLATHGNCIASSIPMALHDAIQQGRLQRGQTCLLCGTSAGFSVGAVLLRY